MAAPIVHQAGDIVAESAMTAQDVVTSLSQEINHQEINSVSHYHYQDQMHVAESATDLRFRRQVEDTVHGPMVLDMRRKHL